MPPGLASGDRVAVLGLGRSGLAATGLLLRLGCRVRAFEQRVSDEVRAAWEPHREAGAELVAGEPPAGVLAGCRMLIRSPGVPSESPLITEANELGIPVRSELNLGATQIATPMIAITGTNGKSTTTAWTAHLLRSAGVRARAAGNIGHALSRAVLEEPAGTVFVVEVSSFQLEDSPDVHPHAATILNITPDHLDRHGSFEAYAAAKWALVANQTTGDLLVVGPDLPLPGGMALPMRVVRCNPAPTAAANPAPTGAPTASAGQPAEMTGQPAETTGQHAAITGQPAEMAAVIVREGLLLWTGALGGAERELLPVNQLALPGPHNRCNAMVALALASTVVDEVGALVPGLRDFPGLAHRLEEVGRIGGVVMINDSKSTNVDSLRVALHSYTEPVVLVAGGRDKQGPFEELHELAGRHVGHLVAVGEAAERIRTAWPRVPSERASSFEDALDRAVRAAQPAGRVLLSPGCASFDMFRNFEERGEAFRSYVRSRQRLGESSSEVRS